MNQQMPNHQMSNQNVTKLTEEHAAVVTAFLSSYEAFITSKVGSVDLTEEDYDQLHPDDLEKWICSGT